MKKVLVVCHGNKWRSPMAAYLLAKIHSAWDVRSGGVGPGAGKGHPAAKAVREAVGGLGQHRSRAVEREDLHWADLILYMDDGNRRRLLALGADPAKLRCLATETPRIKDPAFCRVGSSEQREIFEQIVREVLRV